MKKVISVISIVLLGVILVGCSNKVTSKDLMANDWEFVMEDDEESLAAIASFSDHIMTLSFDPDSMETTASNEWEELGEEIGKQFVKNMKFKVEYELSGDTIHLKDNDLELDDDYTIKKEDKNIVLTPKKDDSDSSVTLKPYTKSKKKSNVTTKSSEKATAPVKLETVIEKFKKDGLAVNDARAMTKDDFGMAPLKAKESQIFGIQLDSNGEYQNARMFSFDDIDDLTDTKDYYDELGESSSITFSYTAADKNKLLLMQFNGDLPQELVEKYVKSAGLTLTPVKFAPSDSKDDDEMDLQEGDTSRNTQPSNNTQQQTEINKQQAEQRAIQQEQEAQRQQEQQASLEAQQQQAQQQQTQQNQQQQQSPSGSTATVQPGEGLQQIAARSGISVETLAELNGITIEGDTFYPPINVGQQLRIK